MKFLDGIILIKSALLLLASKYAKVDCIHLNFPSLIQRGSCASISRQSTTRVFSFSTNTNVLESMNCFQKTVANNTIVLIDGDNVRGKTKFSVTKMNLLEDVIAWANHYNQRGKIILFFDHGSRQQAFHFQDQGIAVAFSGRKKADDVISRDVGWIQSTLRKNIVVITEDLELRQRCKRAVSPTRLSKKKEKKRLENSIVNDTASNHSNDEPIEPLGLYAVSSPSFVGMLYNNTDDGLKPVISPTDTMIDKYSTVSQTPVEPSSSISASPQTSLDLFRQEMSIRQQIENIQRMIVRNSGQKKSRRVVADFKRKLRMMSARLDRFLLVNQAVLSSSSNLNISTNNSSLLHSSSSSNSSSNSSLFMDKNETDTKLKIARETRYQDDGREQELDFELDEEAADKVQEEVIRRGAALLSRTPMPAHKEETWQRVILAEEMRRNLIAMFGEKPSNQVDPLQTNSDSESPATLQDYVNYYNSK